MSTPRIRPGQATLTALLMAAATLGWSADGDPAVARKAFHRGVPIKKDDPAGKLVGFWEQTADGERVDFPPASILDVDVNSTLQITLTGSSWAKLPALRPNPELLRRTEDLRQLEDHFNLLLVSQRGLVKAYDELKASRNPRALEEYRAKVHQQGSAGGNLFGSLQNYVAAWDRSPGEAAPGDVRKQALVTGGIPKTLGPYLATQATILQGLLKEQQEQGGLRLDLGAWLTSNGKSSQVHVPGYDNLTPGTANFIDKTSFVLPPDYGAQVAATEALAKSLGTGKTLADALARDLRGQLGSLLDETGAIQKAFQDLEQTWTSAAKAKAADFQTRYQLLKAAEAKLAGDCAQAKNLLEALAASPDPAALMASALGTLQNLATDTQNLAMALAAFKAWLATQAEDVRALVGSSLATVETPLKLLGFLFDSSALAGSTPDLRTLAVPLTAATDTEIPLLTTARKDGDQMTIRARIIRPAGNGGDQVLAEQSQLLRIKAMGLTTDVGASVQFIQVGGDARKAWVPCPSAFAVYRWNGTRKAGQADEGFFGHLRPGLGVMTSTVAVPDGSTQLAVGATVHLFGDVIQVSTGCTLSGRHFFSFGLGLTRLGLGKILN